MLALAALTVLSVAGRSLLDRPIPGDFELVKIGCAVAVFAFLPYCQLRRANVAVDFLLTRLSRRRRAVLDGVHEFVYALLAAVFTWRLALGGADLFRYGETSMILEVPLWWGFVPIVASAGLLLVVCLYGCLTKLREGLG